MSDIVYEHVLGTASRFLNYFDYGRVTARLLLTVMSTEVMQLDSTAIGIMSGYLSDSLDGGT